MFSKAMQLARDLFHGSSSQSSEMKPTSSDHEVSLVTSQDPNTRVMLSARSHLSGVSVRFDLGEYKRGTVVVELRPAHDDNVEPLRQMTIDLSKFDSGDTEHLYWDPVEESKDRSYLLYFALSPDCIAVKLVATASA